VQVLPGTPEAAEVRQELDRILGSSVFRGSKRCQDFLRYVAEQALDGAAATLKERTLAIEVFGRHNSAELGDDSIVRVGAREVRKRLAQYYVTDGANDLIRIDLPAGSYVPVFHYHTGERELPAASPAVVSVAEFAPVPIAGHRHRTKRVVLPLVAGTLLAVALALALGLLRGRNEPFDEFWKPILRSSAPPMIVLPHPIVYHPSAKASGLDMAASSDSSLPLQHPIRVDPRFLNGSDFVPVLDRYVAFSDAIAALRLTTLLTRAGRAPKFRLASKIEFNDLRDATPLLIGAFTNRWTAEVTKDMRFHFALRGGKPGITDSATGRFWSLPSKRDNGRSDEDYLLICRLPHSQTGGVMLIGAGINVYGTEEAGRILSEPDLLNPILRQLSKDWQNANLELILHVEVVGETPALPKVVAVQLSKP
jgi:hypothetical protein